jgi:hypothetical protein
VITALFRKADCLQAAFFSPGVCLEAPLLGSKTASAETVLVENDHEMEKIT